MNIISSRPKCIQDIKEGESNCEDEGRHTRLIKSTWAPNSQLPTKYSSYTNLLSQFMLLGI